MIDHDTQLLSAVIDHDTQLLSAVIDHDTQLMSAVIDHDTQLQGHRIHTYPVTLKLGIVIYHGTL